MKQKQKFEILAFGSSTGGPEALAAVLKDLPKSFSVPIVIVQHSPHGFTKKLANQLSKETEFTVKEAEHDEVLKNHHIYIAPAGKHMRVQKKLTYSKIILNTDQPVNSCRPAVDVLFESLALQYKNSCLAIVLTGMGSDGMAGALSIKNQGGSVLAQDEKTSVVWGMPKAVVDSGCVEKVLPLQEIARNILLRIPS